MLDAGSRFLLICGPQGCGKSGIAAQAAALMVSEGQLERATWVEMRGIRSIKQAGALKR